MAGVEARLLADELRCITPMYGKCEQSFAVCSFVKFVFQLDCLGLCLDGGNKSADRDIDEAEKTFIVPIVPIGIMDTDLNDTFGMDGSVNQRSISTSPKSKIEPTCDKEVRPRDTPYRNLDSHGLRKGYEAARHPQ